MKLFRTGNIEVVKNCQVCFEFSLPSVIVSWTCEEIWD